MGICGCSACEVGGAEALKAYDRAFEVRRDAAASQAEKSREATLPAQISPNPAIYENQPTEGSTLGSVINISA